MVDRQKVMEDAKAIIEKRRDSLAYAAPEVQDSHWNNLWVDVVELCLTVAERERTAVITQSDTASGQTR